LSSQGDSKFNLYNRQFPFDYVKSFTVNDVSDTDGIDVTNKAIDDLYTQGFLVVQDGYNSPDNQNFKIIDMEQVLKKKVKNPGSID
jgi:3-phytase (myo-inositol-hexaphosphate 3-phosphohydrolase)